MFDGSGVNSSDRQIEIHPAEYFDTGNFLANDICKRARWVVVILQYDRAHATRLRKLRNIDRINRARPVVRITMNVDIDGAA